MSNPPRRKGTAAESALVAWFRLHGFPFADRQPLRGNRDQGDIALCPGVVVEVKNHAGAPALGAPGPKVLAAWLTQAETERTNADADLCPLVVKRAGTNDPGRWFAYLPLEDLAQLPLNDIARPYEDLTQRPYWSHTSLGRLPACVDVTTLARLLRTGGYGTPTESEET